MRKTAPRPRAVAPPASFLLALLIMFPPVFSANAREALLIDELPGQAQLADVSPSVIDVLASQRWRILPGEPDRIRASHFDQRNVCRFELFMRGNRLFIADDCRKAGNAGRWVESAERRAVPESWLRPVRSELRRRFPRPTPAAQQ